MGVGTSRTATGTATGSGSTTKCPAICVHFVGGSCFCCRWRCHLSSSAVQRQKANFGSRQALSHYSKKLCRKKWRKITGKIGGVGSTFGGGDTFWHLSKVHPTAKHRKCVAPGNGFSVNICATLQNQVFPCLQCKVYIPRRQYQLSISQKKHECLSRDIGISWEVIGLRNS